MKHVFAIALLLLLAGCATTQLGPQATTQEPAQAAEDAKDAIDVELICSGLCPEYYEDTLYPVLLPAVERGDVELEVTEMFMFEEPSDPEELVGVRCAYITDGLDAGVELGKETLGLTEATDAQMQELAQQIDLSTQWRTCYTSRFDQVLTALKQEKQDALERGLNGDPTIVVNGEAFVGGLPPVVANATRAIQDQLS